jgi:glutamate N-acetyltransferase / amino-acid N-acetyltransferase
MRKLADKEITDISGVYGAGLCCGIKTGATNVKRDLAFVYVPEAVSCAGVVTTNKFRAPCIYHTEKAIRTGQIKAIIVNSGNANAATGEKGFEAVKQTAKMAAELLNLQPENIAIASTGIIGVALPVDRLCSGLESLLANPKTNFGEQVTEAIMTTDLVPKKIFIEKEIAGKLVQVAGIAKGSGMISPNMATMLAYLVTDAEVPQELLQTMFSEAVDRSFNMMSVDTDTSTSDMALIFSTGKVSGVVNYGDQLQELIDEACVSLAKQIARDGEGATKLIEAQVIGANSLSDARAIAKSIIDSPLIKTAIHGADPNWGRVAMAIGKVNTANLDAARVEISFAGHKVFADGKPLEFNREQIIKELKQETVVVGVDLRVGEFSAIAWGCDLTKGYIDINTDYS